MVCNGWNCLPLFILFVLVLTKAWFSAIQTKHKDLNASHRPSINNCVLNMLLTKGLVWLSNCIWKHFSPHFSSTGNKGSVWQFLEFFKNLIIMTICHLSCIKLSSMLKWESSRLKCPAHCWFVPFQILLLNAVNKKISALITPADSD